jgi:hypothetical protein
MTTPSIIAPFTPVGSQLVPMHSECSGHSSASPCHDPSNYAFDCRVMVTVRSSEQAMSTGRHVNRWAIHSTAALDQCSLFSTVFKQGRTKPTAPSERPRVHPECCPPPRALENAVHPIWRLWSPQLSGTGAQGGHSERQWACVVPQIEIKKYPEGSTPPICRYLDTLPSQFRFWQSHTDHISQTGLLCSFGVSRYRAHPDALGAGISIGQLYLSTEQ